MRPRPNFRRPVLFSLGTLAILATSVLPHAAHAAAAPSLGSQLTLGGAAAYPRGASTAWTATVDATESASFQVTASAVDATTELLSCSTDAGVACVISSGRVDVAADGDVTEVEPVVVTVVGRARPSVTVPLGSTEGAAMAPANRALTVRTTPVTGTTGIETSRVLQLPVTTNVDTQAVVEITTLTPGEGVTATRGGTVAYRATLTRTGNSAAETAVGLKLIPGPLGVSGTTAPVGTAMVMIAPGVQSVTVQLSAQVPTTALEGTAHWHLQATWGVDTEVGADRTFLVPAAPPAPDPEPQPEPQPGPVVISPTPTTPSGTGGPTAAATAKPAAARDTTPPVMGIALLTPQFMAVRRGDRPRIKLRYDCPLAETRCSMVASVWWRPAPGRPLIRLGIGKLVLTGGTSGTSTFLLTTGARRFLQQRGSLRVQLRVATRDAAGNLDDSSLRMKLRSVR